MLRCAVPEPVLVVWLTILLGVGWGVGRVVPLGLVQVAVYSGQGQAAVWFRLDRVALPVLVVLLGVLWGVGRAPRE